MLDGDAIKQDAATGGRLKPGNEVGERGLAATRWPHERKRLAWGHSQVNARQGVSLRPRIAKAHVLENQFTAGAFNRLRAGIGLDGLVHEFEDHIGCGQRALQVRIDSRQMLEGCQQHQHRRQKRDKTPDTGLIGSGLRQRDRNDHCHGQRGRHLRGGHDRGAGHGHASGEMAQPFVDRSKARLLIRLPAVDFDHRVAPDGFFDDAGHVAGMTHLLGRQTPHAP